MITVAVSLIAAIGLIVFLVSRPAKEAAPTQSSPTGSSQNTNSEQACIDTWYKQHPEARPENRKPGDVQLAPPCDGNPQ